MASDDFLRGDFPTLGSNWTVSTGSSSNFEIATNQASNAGGGNTLDSFTNVAAPNDQSSQITLKALTSTTDSGPGPAVRIATGAMTAYFAQCNTTEIKLYKVVANSFSQLGSDAAAAAVNDIIYIEATGSATVHIVVKKNGSAIITQDDSASDRITSGNWGMWVSAGGNPSNTLQVDDWVGLAAGSSSNTSITPTAGSGTAVGLGSILGTGLTPGSMIAGT